MAATGSNYLYTEMSEFFLNDLLGYQDVNENNDGLNRLEAAFAAQHMWDRTSDDGAWAGAHAPDPTLGDSRNLGNHGGNIGVDDGADQTEYFGSGTYLHGIQHVVYGTYIGNGADNRLIATGLRSDITCVFVAIQGWVTVLGGWVNGIAFAIGGGLVAKMGVHSSQTHIVFGAQATGRIVLNANQNFIVGDSAGGPNYSSGAPTYYYVAIGV